jgi:hypothetical protein
MINDDERFDEFVRDAQRVEPRAAAVADVERALRDDDGRETLFRWMGEAPFPRAPVLAFSILMLVSSFAAGWHFAELHPSGIATQKDPNKNEQGVAVTFLLVDPGAHEVSVVGAFNDWTPDRTRLVKSSGNVWTVVVPLKPGSYNYAFVIDGQKWVPDPDAPRATEEDFGRPSSMLYVEKKGTSREAI